MLARDAGFLLYSRLWGTVQSFNCRNQAWLLKKEQRKEILPRLRVLPVAGVLLHNGIITTSSRPRLVFALG
jgi:hypothetical protein